MHHFHGGPLLQVFREQTAADDRKKTTTQKQTHALTHTLTLTLRSAHIFNQVLYPSPLHNSIKLH